MIEIKQEKNGGRSLSLKSKENWFTLLKTSRNLLWWSIFAKALKHSYVVFLVCFAMVQVMLSYWSLFIEFLGSCSRWRVTNGLLPRVLGPTNFYLKFWVNWNTSECCCVHHDLHLGSCGWMVRCVYGFHHMNITWIYGLYYEDCSCTYFRMFLDQMFFQICLGTSAGLIKWNYHFKPML